MDYTSGISSNHPAINRKNPAFEKISRKILALILIGSGMAVLAAFAGGSLYQISELAETGLDSASNHAGLIVKSVHTPGITGHARNTIMQTSGILPGQTQTWRANPNKIREKLYTLKSIGRVQVLRHWPGRIIILADPRKSAALHHDGQKWTVIDRGGHVLHNNKIAKLPNLPKLAGLQNGENIDPILSDLERFPRLTAKMAYANRINGRRWDMVLDSGTRLLLPEDGKRAQAITLVAHLHQHTHLLEGSLESLDLRQPGYLIIKKARRKKPETPQLSLQLTTPPNGDKANKA